MKLISWYSPRIIQSKDYAASLNLVHPSERKESNKKPPNLCIKARSGKATNEDDKKRKSTIIPLHHANRTALWNQFDAQLDFLTRKKWWMNWRSLNQGLTQALDITKIAQEEGKMNAGRAHNFPLQPTRKKKEKKKEEKETQETQGRWERFYLVGIELCVGPNRGRVLLHRYRSMEMRSSWAQ